MQKDEREEVTEVVFAGPFDGISPTIFSRFAYDLVVNLERKIRLGFERFNGLVSSGFRTTAVKEELTDFIGVSLATFGSVNTPIYTANLEGLKDGLSVDTYFPGFHVFEIHADFSGHTISKAEVRRSDLFRLLSQQNKSVDRAK